MAFFLQKISLQCVLAAALVLVVLLLSLMSDQSLAYLYVTAGQSLGADPLWIRRHGWQISNYGHFLTSFLLVFIIVSGRRLHQVKIVLLILAFLAIVEISQSFIPTRQASLSDFSYDLFGALLGFCLVWVQMRKQSGEERSHKGQPFTIDKT